MAANEAAYEHMKAVRGVLAEQDASEVLIRIARSLRSAGEEISFFQDPSVRLLGERMVSLAGEAEKLQGGLAAIETVMAGLL